jgi:hypothetical protein
MCCFSGPVINVNQTNIFARSAGSGRQFLVYAMSLSADADVAMILPLPVPPSPPEDAVRFIDLHGYPTFFEDVESAFPQRESRLEGGYNLRAQAVLKVHDVGDFEASFVPRLADFDRLDERFRLPQGVWDQLPAYADFGFAVFKLRGGASGRAQEKTIHPMAFEFPVRDPSVLFFPTVHIHDGAVHPTARFDHVLYFQGDFPDFADDEKSCPARTTVDVSRAAGVVDADAPFQRLMLYGAYPNRDTFVGDGHRGQERVWV